MERLDLQEHAVMVALSKSDKAKWYVRTPNCKTSTIKTLYAMGYVTTDRLLQGQPLRIKITELGEEYGRRFCSTNKNTTDK